MTEEIIYIISKYFKNNYTKLYEMYGESKFIKFVKNNFDKFYTLYSCTDILGHAEKIIRLLKKYIDKYTKYKSFISICDNIVSICREYIKNSFKDIIKGKKIHNVYSILIGKIFNNNKIEREDLKNINITDIFDYKNPSKYSFDNVKNLYPPLNKISKYVDYSKNSNLSAKLFTT